MAWITRYFMYKDKEVRLCDPENGHILTLCDGHPIECKYNNDNESFIFDGNVVYLKDCKLR